VVCAWCARVFLSDMRSVCVFSSGDVESNVMAKRIDLAALGAPRQ